MTEPPDTGAPATDGSDTEPVDVDSLVSTAQAAIAGATSVEEIRRVAASVSGKRSPLAEASRSLGALQPAARKALGQQLHQARATIDGFLEQRRDALEAGERSRQMAEARLDLTEFIPGSIPAPVARGHLHLVSQTRDSLEDVFVGMGFEVAEGPEIETDWFNFGALNMPPAHPARSMFDTFYLNLGPPESTVLRTHTSPVQIHLMEEAVDRGTLPIHAVMPGRAYRHETEDARHLAVFHQIEGLVVDKGITFADLAGTIEVFTTAYFGPDIHSRLRPAYFPFTEPSAEFEVTCTICHGQGCRTCSQTGWIELGGCGMVDPAVFDAVGIDADAWTGFAFGFGIDRCAQMRHQIADMRALTENDLRFLRQF